MRNTELSAKISIQNLSNYYIPLCLGLVGACVRIIRRLDACLENHTLNPNDAMRAFLRIFLGAMLGALICLIFDNGSVEINNLKLSLGFLAFLAGYSVQWVFDLLDQIIAFGSRLLRQGNVETRQTTGSTR